MLFQIQAESTQLNPANNELYLPSLIDLNTMVCHLKVNSYTIEPTLHPSCYCILVLLCVIYVILYFVSEIHKFRNIALFLNTDVCINDSSEFQTWLVLNS